MLLKGTVHGGKTAITGVSGDILQTAVGVRKHYKLCVSEPLILNKLGEGFPVILPELGGELTAIHMELIGNC